MARSFLLPLIALSLSVLPPRLAADQAFLRAAAETNVNQHYTIESISIGGVKVEEAKLPSTLRNRFTALLGERCDVVRLQDLAGDLRRELHLQAVSESLLRGSRPGRVRVNFEVVQKQVAFDLSVPTLRYRSGEGWSGELEGVARAGRNLASVAAISNSDELAERFSGVRARYENSKIGAERLRFRLEVEDYRTERTDYRLRRDVAPELTFAIARPLTVSAGLSFEQMQMNQTGPLAANAFTAEVHYGHQIEGDTAQQKLDGRYNLRAATAALGSDFAYSRHTVSLRYEVKSGRRTASDEMTAGVLAGAAPSFERFVAGSHFAPEATGGQRMVRNAVTCGYQMGDRTGEVFYDTANTGHGMRHSTGVAYRQGIFVVAMAFPVVEGRVLPVFMAGMNY